MDPRPLTPAITSSSPATPPAKFDLIPTLPDHIAILCIARVSRRHHPFLATVSRGWRALIRSDHLFSIRHQIGASQPFLLINLCTPKVQFHWYIIDCHRRNRSSRLNPIPPPPLAYAFGCSPVALGYSLFLLGGFIDGIPSPVVQIYDFRFNSWRLGTPMLVARQFCTAGVISGRIYAVGGCLPCIDCWVEEFDPDKKRWRKISSPPEILAKWVPGNADAGGKLFDMMGQGGMVFDPAVAAVEAKLTDENLVWRGRAIVVGDILFSYSCSGGIIWYDFTKNEWMRVEGVDKQLPKHFKEIAIGNLGELLCLFYEKRRKGKKMEVICAGIRITKTNTRGLDGSVEWFKMLVLEFSKQIRSSHCLSLGF